MDSTSRPAMLLVTGRSVGLAASFAIGIVLARLFDPAVFGVYKQFFLIYATLYGVLQLGMAESLYYFVPRKPEHTGRYAANAIVALALTGAASIAVLFFARPMLAGWLNPELAEYAIPLGLFLTFMLTATVLEIVMVSRQKHLAAAVTYAISDIVRTLLFIGPALMFASLEAVFVGATVFAGLRLAATLVALWRLCGRDLRIDSSLLRQQLGYALPFALAVGIEVVLINYHQYVVAARFDAATFAIYAIGCLQIPLYDLIVTSTVNILMVRMADAPRGEAAVALWHDTVCRLAFLIFPLAALLVVGAHDLIVGLFTATYSRQRSDLHRVGADHAAGGNGGGRGAQGLRADALPAHHEPGALCVRGRAHRHVPVVVRADRRRARRAARIDGDQDSRSRPRRMAHAARRARRAALAATGRHHCHRGSVHSAGALAASHCRVASPDHVHRRRGSLRRHLRAALLYRLAAALASSHKSQGTSHKSETSVL